MAVGIQGHLISENHFFRQIFSELEQETYNSSGPNQAILFGQLLHEAHLRRGTAWNGQGVNQFVIGLGFRTWSARRPITFDAGLIVAPEGGLVLTPWFSVSKGFRPNLTQQEQGEHLSAQKDKDRSRTNQPSPDTMSRVILGRCNSTKRTTHFPELHPPLPKRQEMR